MPDITSILAEQLAYYRAAANEYEDYRFAVPGLDELLAAIDAFRPTGDVLELACGADIWTQHLVRSATTITAVDAAPEMLARARARSGVASVRFIEADLFSWRPDGRYDTVFFGFWLSHVPEEQFESFWSLVGECLRPGGDVFFFDDSYRTDAELIEGRTRQSLNGDSRTARPSASSRSLSEPKTSNGDYVGWDGTSS